MRLAENTGRKKSPSGHHRTTLSGYIFAIKAHIDNWEKTFYIAISPPRVLTIWWSSATSDWDCFVSFGHPS